MRIGWSVIEDVLSGYCDELSSAIEPRLKQLREQFPRKVTETTYSWLRYGPYGTSGFHSSSEEKIELDAEKVRKWILKEKGVTESFHAQLSIVFGCDETAEKLLFELTELCVQYFEEEKSWQDALEAFRVQYFDESVEYPLELTCPIYNLVMDNKPFTYEGHGVCLIISRPEPRALPTLEVFDAFRPGDAMPDSVLMLRCFAVAHEAREAIRALGMSLRLFSPNSIVFGHHKVRPRRFTGGNASLLVGQGGTRPSSKLCFRLSSANAAALRTYLDFVLPILVKTEKAETSLSLAIDAYFRALGESQLWNRQVATAVMAIEALLMGDSNSDLKFKAAYRSAKVCEALGYDPLSVRDLIMLAYDVRSAYVHGSTLKASSLKKTTKLSGSPSRFSYQICDIVRAMTLAMIVSDAKKESLIPIIDDSFLSQDAHRRLLETFAAVGKINRPYEGLSSYYDHFEWRGRLAEEEYETIRNTTQGQSFAEDQGQSGSK